MFSFVFFLIICKYGSAKSENVIIKNENISVQSPLSISKCINSEITQESIIVPNFMLKKWIESEKTVLSEISFRLTQRNLDCTESHKINITLNEKDVKIRPTFLLSNGFMRFQKSYLSPSQFCVNRKSESSIDFTICKPNHEKCSAEYPCIRKCCELDQVIDLTQYVEDGKISCVQTQKQWSPQLYKDKYSKSDKSPKLQFIKHHPKTFCNDSISLRSLRPFYSQDALPFRILQDGSIIAKTERKNWTHYNNFETCVDGAENFQLSEYETELSGPFTGNEEDTVLIECISTQFAEDNAEGKVENNLYVIALSIAIIFLLLTLIAHIILWKKQTIRGWTLMGYVSFLAAEFGFLIIARLTRHHGVICTSAAIGTHFTALGTYSWLSATNFDVWWSFRTMAPCVSKKAQLKLFFMYATFATLIPVSIVTIAILLERIYGADPFSEVLVPEYGKTKCGLGINSEWSYLFAPIVVLLSSNLIFLSSTLYYIYKHQNTLSSPGGIKKTILKDKLQFFGMLFLVAGVTWIFEVLSWYNSTPTKATLWYWMFFDFVNIFQAIAIFAIFVCNRKTMHNLQKELPWLKYLNLWSSSEDRKLPTKGMMRREGEDDARKMSITQVYCISDYDKNNIELK